MSRSTLADPGAHQGLTWRGLLRVAAVADLVLILVVGTALWDRETIALGIIFAAGILLLGWRGGRAGHVLLVLLFVDCVAFMLPAAAVNLVNREELLDVVVPVSLTVISATGFLAAVLPTLAKNPSRERRIPRLLWQVAVAVIVLAVAVTVVGRNREGAHVRQPGDLVVVSEDTAFRPKELRAPAGTVSLFVQNEDLFWHTLTIDALGLDIKLPTGAERRATFTAEPGRYRFFCAVPGHTIAGMEGTLIIG